LKGGARGALLFVTVSERDFTMSMFPTRIDYELHTAALILANVNQNPNYPQIEHAQGLAQSLADEFERRGYFLSGEEAKNAPLHRFEAAPVGDSPNAERVIGAVGGHSRVQFVRGAAAQVNQR
jgi:hypothetical protein